MSQLQTITIGNKGINFYTVRGEVMDEKKWTTTHVSGGGGGGYVHQGSGYVSSSSVTSRIQEHDQFFLRTDDGKEVPVTLDNAGLALRKGHSVSLLWGIKKGKERGPYLAVHNHTTDDTTVLNQGLRELEGLGIGLTLVSIAALIFGLIVGIPGLWALFTVPGHFFNQLLGAGVGLGVAWLCWKFLANHVARSKMLRSAVNAQVERIKARKQM